MGCMYGDELGVYVRGEASGEGYGEVHEDKPYFREREKTDARFFVWSYLWHGHGHEATSMPWSGVPLAGMIFLSETKTFLITRS